MELSPEDAKELVRRGYDAVSYHYCADDAVETGPREGWLERLAQLVALPAAVLDLGCGCGLPVSRDLVRRGYRVRGVDISDVQIERARRLVPGATFERADATQLDVAVGEFDAIVCLYMLIHVPLDEQPGLLRRMHGWLRPGGLLVATVGHTAWTGTAADWRGGGAPMWWSHADAATYRAWLTEAGFRVEHEEYVPEGKGGHALFWARG